MYFHLFAVCVWVCVYLWLCMCVWVCVYLWLCVCVCDKFGRFDNDEELARVQGDSVDSIVVASAKEGVGGEAVGGGDDVENE